MNESNPQQPYQPYGQPQLLLSPSASDGVPVELLPELRVSQLAA
ncbi:MAG TPA: hypothetical protein VF060_35335 [Trebonia sp.]